MNNMNDYSSLLQLIKIFQTVKQISWSADQTSKRYPAPESLTDKEVQDLTKVYLALGLDLERLYSDWKKIYKEHDKK